MHTYTLSGKESHIVNDYFGSFKGLGIAGEHGFFYKWPRDTQWLSISETIDDSWKESCRVSMGLVCVWYMMCLMMCIVYVREWCKRCLYAFKWRILCMVYSGISI
ncbi:hypothetical protein EON65_11250 [archaeon]|nr:MAG: hypothetical protein EON65_11250 [archaeon]